MTHPPPQLMTERKHARLAPSSAHRWMNCPGSIALSEGLEESPSWFAAEGTAAHQVAERCLSGAWTPSRFLDTVERADGMNFTVDPEMVDGVQMYLDVCREIMGESDEYAIEERLDVSSIVDGVYGTGDFVAYRQAPTRRATIVDLKYGRGVAVSVAANEQLLTYALGVAQRYHNRGVDEVELVVVQPRAPHPDGPVRRWVTDIIGLHEHAMALQQAADKINSGEQELVPGDWCQFCDATAICPALANTVEDIVGNEDPRMYDAETLAKKMLSLTVVKNWCAGVEKFAHAEVVRGKVLPGLKLVYKRAMRRWKNEVEAIEWMGLMGIEPYEKVRSPAQVEMELPRKDRRIIAELAESRSSGTVLAPLDDPRPAVDPANASGFEAMEGE